MPLFITAIQNGIDHNPLRSQRGIALQAAIKSVVPQLITKVKVLNA